MAGILAGAMAGGGAAAQTLANQGADYLVKSTLQGEAAAIQAARDERLAELRKGELQYADELRRKPAQDAAAEIEKAKGEHVDDLSGTVRKRTRSEMADVEESAYRKQGLVTEAQGVRNTEMQRERDIDARLGRARDDERADRQLDISAKNFDITAKGAKLDHQIKQITLDNAKRVDELRKEFDKATPERKAQINEQLQVLTGKDNDWYLPVPLKDETGAITGYKIFDRRRGVWVDDQGAGGGTPTAADIEGLVRRANDPKAIEHFERKFGKGSAAKHLPQAKPKHPGDRILPPKRNRGLVEEEFEGDSRMPE